MQTDEIIMAYNAKLITYIEARNNLRTDGFELDPEPEAQEESMKCEAPIDDVEAPEVES